MKRKEKLDKLSEEQKTEIIEFYKKHSSPLTCKTFNICYNVLCKLLNQFNITKHSQTQGNFLAKMDNYGYSFYSENKEHDIIDFYKNHSFNHTLNNFEIKAFYLTYLLEKYCVKKHTRIEERKLSSLYIYGTEFPSQAEGIKEKTKKTKENKSDEELLLANNKRRDTLLKRYGSETYNNRELAKATSIKKYGADNIFKTKEFQEISKNTRKEKYGSENYTNREKAKQTCLKKYNSETFLGSEAGQKAIKSYNQNKYGVNYAFQSAEWQQKELEHRKELYPDNYNNRELAAHTCFERYGVEYFCIDDNCRGKGNGYRSKPNDVFAKLLDDNHINYVREFKLYKYSYDFKVDNTLIEIDPTITHNVTLSPYMSDCSKYKTYHKEKSELAEKNGYRCIHVWDWTNIPIILDIINPNKEKIFARKCICKIIDKKVADDFINENHLQKMCRGNIYNFGLYYEDKLIEVMTFGKPRYNKKYDLELLRLCVLMGHIVIGGAEKLFKFALKHITGKSIISYCDRSVFSGKVYSKLGFKFVNLSVNKHWYNLKTKEHILDSYLNSLGFDKIFKTNYGKNTSNTILMLQHDFLELYDAGQATYVFER